VRGIELGGETLLRPGSGEDVDLQHRVDAEAARNDRAFEATGTLRQGCYAGVLTPQHPVKVKLGTTPTSGTYTIDKVTHRLGRSEYQQQFMLYAERLEASAAGGGLIPAGLF
jgi:phage protein D